MKWLVSIIAEGYRLMHHNTPAAYRWSIRGWLFTAGGMCLTVMRFAGCVDGPLRINDVSALFGILSVVCFGQSFILIRRNYVVRMKAFEVERMLSGQNSPYGPPRP